MLLELSLVVVVLWLVLKAYNRHTEQCASNIPGINGYPLIGNALTLMSLKTVDDVLGWFRESTKIYDDKGLAKGWLGPILWLLIFDPKYVEALATSPNASSKGHLYELIFGRMFNGVFITDDKQKWKELRKPFHKLTTKKLLSNHHHQVFLRKGKELVQHIRENRCGQEYDLLLDIYHVMTDVVSETLLGVRTNELKNPKFFLLEALDSFLAYVIDEEAKLFPLKLMKILPKLPIEIEKDCKRFTAFFDWAIEERSKTGRLENLDGTEFYTDFIKRRQHEKNISKEDVYKEILDVFIAGADTVSVTLTSTLLFIAMHPDIQEKAYQEQLSIFGSDKEQEPTLENLSSMVYLSRVIKEAGRVTSTAIIYNKLSGDVKLDNYILPKGAVFGVFVEKLHHDPKHWQKPMEFYPDHFTPENESTRHPYAYIPFGYGPRMCIGMQFGINMMKVFLSYVLRNFKSSTSLKYEDLTYKYKLLREVKGEYKITFVERT